MSKKLYILKYLFLDSIILLYIHINEVNFCQLLFFVWLLIKNKSNYINNSY